MIVIIHKWSKLGVVVTLSRSVLHTKFTPRDHRPLIQEVTKEPRTTSKELKASVVSVKVGVHDSETKKTTQKWHQRESSKGTTTADQKQSKAFFLMLKICPPLHLMKN